MIGVEGYVESAAAGLLAAINAARLINGHEPVVPPCETALGSLIAYITNPSRREFQPINANYALMPELHNTLRGRQRKMAMGERALRSLDDWIRFNCIAGCTAAALASAQTAEAEPQKYQSDTRNAAIVFVPPWRHDGVKCRLR